MEKLKGKKSEIYKIINHQAFSIAVTKAFQLVQGNHQKEEKYRRFLSKLEELKNIRFPEDPQGLLNQLNFYKEYAGVMSYLWLDIVFNLNLFCYKSMELDLMRQNPENMTVVDAAYFLEDECKGISGRVSYSNYLDSYQLKYSLQKNTNSAQELLSKQQAIMEQKGAMQGFENELRNALAILHKGLTDTCSISDTDYKHYCAKTNRYRSLSLFTITLIGVSYLLALRGVSRAQKGAVTLRAKIAFGVWNVCAWGAFLGLRQRAHTAAVEGAAELFLWRQKQQIFAKGVPLSFEELQDKLGSDVPDCIRNKIKILYSMRSIFRRSLYFLLLSSYDPVARNR